MSAALFALLALSTWRWTHLIVEDTIPIVAKPREWIENKWPHSNFAYLVGCTWCSSVWVAAAHVIAFDLVTDYDVALPVFVVGALSVLTGFAETIVDWLDRYGME